MDDQGQFKVRLTDSNSPDLQSAKPRTVQFDATPDLIENRNVNYKTLDPMHAPGQLFVYANTSSRTFNLSNIRLISRTPKEASANLERLWILRSWCMPSFGRNEFEDEMQRASREQVRANVGVDAGKISSKMQDRASTPTNRDFLGAPPKVLQLSAYSRLGAQTGVQGLGHIRRVPVVIQQLSIPYPSDTDYIPTDDAQNPTPMPTIMTLDMTMVETHSPAEYQKFNLNDFRNGNLSGF